MSIRLIISICCMSFSMMALAQASGGQIRRNTTRQSVNASNRKPNKVSSSLGNKGNRYDTPQIRVISENDKTCELYFDINKQKTCIPQNRKGKYVIPSKVSGYTIVRIGDFAFSKCDISELEIPNTVTCIGNNAFSGCKNLKIVKIPGSVAELGEHSFEECVHLEDIFIPKSIIQIGRYAFYNCQRLTSVKLSEGLKFIGECAFSGCKALSSIDIPESLDYIDSWAFSGCSILQTVTISGNKKIEVGRLCFNAISKDATLIIKKSGNNSNYAHFFDFFSNIIEH